MIRGLQVAPDTEQPAKSRAPAPPRVRAQTSLVSLAMVLMVVRSQMGPPGAAVEGARRADTLSRTPAVPLIRVNTRIIPTVAIIAGIIPIGFSIHTVFTSNIVTVVTMTITIASTVASITMIDVMTNMITIMPLLSTVFTVVIGCCD